MLIQYDICVTLPKVTCEETSICPNKDKLVKLTCSKTLTQWLAYYCLQLKRFDSLYNYSDDEW